MKMINSLYWIMEHFGVCSLNIKANYCAFQQKNYSSSMRQRQSSGPPSFSRSLLGKSQWMRSAAMILQWHRAERMTFPGFPVMPANCWSSLRECWRVFTRWDASSCLGCWVLPPVLWCCFVGWTVWPHCWTGCPSTVTNACKSPLSKTLLSMWAVW